jgi:hypothetical protein
MNDLAPARRIAPESTAISLAQFAHFVLRTGQIDHMAEWYRTVLAARIVFRDELLRIPPIPEGKTPWDMLPAH